MPVARSVNPVCERTGLTRPECSCPDCLREQIRVHQPELLTADPIGEIVVRRNAASRPGAPASRAA